MPEVLLEIASAMVNSKPDTPRFSKTLFVAAVFGSTVNSNELKNV